MVDAPPRIRLARFDELQPRELYGILKLRSDVFIIEQQCVYDDIDGRDAEPDALHLWMEHEGAVIAALRLLHDRDGCHHIGRVVTHPAHRRRGLAAALMREAMARATPPITIKAQAHLAAWYARFGFVPYGEEFIEDGIPHQRMRLDA
jgi:ElaA protein